MITTEDLKKLDDRELKWYQKQLMRFHQECLKFDKCYGTAPVFHDHLKELECLLLDELNRRKADNETYDITIPFTKANYIKIKSFYEIV